MLGGKARAEARAKARSRKARQHKPAGLPAQQQAVPRVVEAAAAFAAAAFAAAAAATAEGDTGQGAGRRQEGADGADGASGREQSPKWASGAESWTTRLCE